MLQRPGLRPGPRTGAYISAPQIPWLGFGEERQGKGSEGRIRRSEQGRKRKGSEGKDPQQNLPNPPMG